ncbi:hypothetical protein D3C76_1237140 [compost metagenome]
MAGVGIGPSSITSAPAATRPASRADSNMYPEIRVSLPIRMRHLPCLRKAIPAAQPSLSMKSGVIGNCPTCPRIPSVPKYFLLMNMLRVFLFRRLNCSDHAYSVDGFRDIVHAQDAGTLCHRQRGKGETAVQALMDLPSQRLANHAFT